MPGFLFLGASQVNEIKKEKKAQSKMEGKGDKDVILDGNNDSNELIEKTPVSEVNIDSFDLIENEKSDEKTEKSIIPYVVEFRYNIEDLRKHGEELTSTLLPADCPSQLSEYCRELEAFDPRAPKGKLKQTSAVDAHQKWAANKPIPYRNDTLPIHTDASKQQHALKSLLGITKPEEKESTSEGDTRLNDRGTNNLKALLGGGGGASTPGSGGIIVSDSGFPIVHMIAQPRAAASDGAPAHSIPYKQASNTAMSAPVNTGRFANLSKQTTPVSYSNPRPNQPPRTQQSQSQGQSLQGHESAAAQREREIFERERRAIQQERERGKEQQTRPEQVQQPQSVASSIKPAGAPQTFVSYHDECDALMDELMSGSQREERKAPATLPPPASVPVKSSQPPPSPFSSGAMSTQSYLASIDLTSLLAPVGPTSTQRAFQPAAAPKPDAAPFRSMPAADPWGPPGLGAPGLGSYSPLTVPSPWGAPQTSSSLPSSAHASQSSFASTTHTAVHQPVAAEEPGLDPRVTGMLMQLGDDLGVQRPKLTATTTAAAAQEIKVPIKTTSAASVPALASGLTFMAPLPPPSSNKPPPEQPSPALGQVDAATAGRKMSKIDVKQLFSLNSTTPSTTTSLPKPPTAATPSKPTSFAFHSPQPQSSSRQASYDEQDGGGGVGGRGRITIGGGPSPQPTLTNSGGSGSGGGSKPSTVRMSAASRMRLQQISAGKDKAVPPVSSTQTIKSPITHKITHNIGALTVTATPPTTTTSKHTISTQPPTQTLTTITTTTTNTTNTTNTAAGTVEGGTRNMKKIDVRSLFA